MFHVKNESSENTRLYSTVSFYNTKSQFHHAKLRSTSPGLKCYSLYKSYHQILFSTDSTIAPGQTRFSKNEVWEISHYSELCPVTDVQQMTFYSYEPRCFMCIWEHLFWSLSKSVFKLKSCECSPFQLSSNSTYSPCQLEIARGILCISEANAIWFMAIKA